jgi:hypothetical protein
LKSRKVYFGSCFSPWSLGSVASQPTHGEEYAVEQCSSCHHDLEAERDKGRRQGKDNDLQRLAPSDLPFS